MCQRLSDPVPLSWWRHKCVPKPQKWWRWLFTDPPYFPIRKQKLLGWSWLEWLEKHYSICVLQPAVSVEKLHGNYQNLMIKRKQRRLIEIAVHFSFPTKSQVWLSDINSIFPLKRLVALSNNCYAQSQTRRTNNGSVAGHYYWQYQEHNAAKFSFLLNTWVGLWGKWHRIWAPAFMTAWMLKNTN